MICYVSFPALTHLILTFMLTLMLSLMLTWLTFNLNLILIPSSLSILLRAFKKLSTAGTGYGSQCKSQ